MTVVPPTMDLHTSHRGPHVPHLVRPWDLQLLTGMRSQEPQSEAILLDIP